MRFGGLRKSCDGLMSGGPAEQAEQIGDFALGPIFASVRRSDSILGSSLTGCGGSDDEAPSFRA
jgi:hypothetical protein